MRTCVHQCLDGLLKRYAADNPRSVWPDPETRADLHIALDEYIFQGWWDDGDDYITIMDLLGFSFETAQLPEEDAMGISLVMPV